jgi:hypothetical protein
MRKIGEKDMRKIGGTQVKLAFFVRDLRIFVIS